MLPNNSPEKAGTTVLYIIKLLKVYRLYSFMSLYVSYIMPCNLSEHGFTKFLSHSHLTLCNVNSFHKGYHFKVPWFLVQFCFIFAQLLFGFTSISFANLFLFINLGGILLQSVHIFLVFFSLSGVALLFLPHPFLSFNSVCVWHKRFVFSSCFLFDFIFYFVFIADFCPLTPEGNNLCS